MKTFSVLFDTEQQANQYYDSYQSRPDITVYRPKLVKLTDQTEKWEIQGITWLLD